MEVKTLRIGENTLILIAIRRRGLLFPRYYICTRESEVERFKNFCSNHGIDYKLGRTNDYDPFNNHRKQLKRCGLLQSRTGNFEYFILSRGEYKELEKYLPPFEREVKNIETVKKSENKGIKSIETTEEQECRVEEKVPFRNLPERRAFFSYGSWGIKRSELGIVPPSKPKPKLTKQIDVIPLAEKDEEINTREKNKELHIRQLLHFLWERGVIPTLLNKRQLYCDKNYHLGNARGRDSVRNIYGCLIKVGLEREDVYKRMDDYSGVIGITDKGYRELLKILKKYNIGID